MQGGITMYLCLSVTGNCKVKRKGRQGGVTMTQNLHQKVIEGYTQSAVWLAALNFNLKPAVGKPCSLSVYQYFLTTKNVSNVISMGPTSSQ